MTNVFWGQALLVGCGGFIGSMLRFSLHHVMHRLVPGAFPIGTFTVNMLGCLCIGVVLGLVDHRGLLDNSWRLFLAVGVLGGFTTFSSFAFENYSLLAGSDFFKLGLNIVLQLSLGLVFAWVGYEIAK